MPRVAIAMPVYNGGYLLGESLECLRTQTYRDFEVRIFDNGSTDETSDVANGFAERDSRFKVFRSETTIPMGPNFIRSAEQTDCDYFAWRADDDLTGTYDVVWWLSVALGIFSRPVARLAAASAE
jgi:glycosyltransferase involved in cell wall biosynthesis